MKPIIFSTYSVRAIQGNRKTQTRRVIKPQPDANAEYKGIEVGKHTFETDNDMWHIRALYQPGDILWVRETWRKTGTIAEPYAYRAGDEKLHLLGEGGQILTVSYRWRSPRFMPKKAARLFLLVKSVWPEKLQDITEEDARAEGMEIILADTCRQEYMELWDHLNAKRGYPSESNPYVWKIVFERTEKPNGF